MSKQGAGTSDRLDYREPHANPVREIPLWRYVPSMHGPETPVVIVMHGRGRDAHAYRDAWAPHAEAHGFVVVAPEFARAAYAGAHSYNFGNMVTESGEPLPRKAWLFPVIDRIVDRVRDDLGLRRGEYALYGHSAGAQFVHRLVTFAWSNRIALAITANSGSYTLPHFGIAYPFGLAATDFAEGELSALLSRPLVVLLGESDNDPRHPGLPAQPEAQDQGPHRFARGLNYLAVAREVASERGLDLKWRLETVPGVGHSNPGMAPVAARLCAEALRGEGSQRQDTKRR